ncbi:SulP family inorganic anion transporter [Hymenobacter yonginensis]|uniref:SulP family inorganic anion transporter n=1 Tax=Hymenobacter yonginensis TaxID=748197 RepID=A0ABY7PUR6_9BACT|nr:SulP family inorganic anion transporter [Hymenobacter yonginensis]WBO86553.1 SulP family inorganic anion transporter [Hymenobacter yonginensis]
MFQVLPYLAQYKINVKNEILAGLTTALALVPEVVAFALLAHISPLVGIGSAFVICLITSVFGGRPGMISGAAGSVAVVIVALVAQHGVEYLFLAVALMGVLQIAVGLLRFGKFIRLVPQPVVYGFVNGLAVIIFMAQLEQFKVPGAGGEEQWLQGTPLLLMLGLVALTMAIVYLLPKLTKAVPASLVAIIVVSALVIGGNLDTKSVGDIASIKGVLPTLHWPQVPLTWATLALVLPYSVIMALVGLTESLLTLTVVDEMTDTRGHGNQDCVAQGLANVASGLTGGMGGCAMIGQTMVNLESRGRGRLSGVVAALALALFVVAGSSLIEQLPLAALVGVMFMVVIGTFEWASLRILRRMPRADVLVMLLVTLVTAVSQNLALAVLLGVVISALVFAWENAKRIRARKHTDDAGTRHYEIYGPLFFGSVQAFTDKFDVQQDPAQVVIDFRESRVADMSGIDALHKLTERYHRLGKTLHLRHLSPDCRQLLRNAGALIEVNIQEDPEYRVVTAE